LGEYDADSVQLIWHCYSFNQDVIIKKARLMQHNVSLL